MRETPLPLTAGDLRELAYAVEEIETTVLAANPTIRRIELGVGGAQEHAGYAVRFEDDDPDMGWGFVTIADETRSTA